MHELTFPLLRLLAAGEFRSGERLSAELSVSRATVWNVLRSAQALGVEVEAVHGRGYRLAKAIDWLPPDTIGASAALHDWRLDLVDCCESTNSELMRRAAQGAPHRSMLVTELQTRGRGRQGRAWHARLGDALTFSLLWRFAQGAAALSGLSLAVGVAVRSALLAAGSHVGLKWPNDLLCGEAKLGGILIELSGDMLGPSVAVIGIGLNVRNSAALGEVGQAVTDIESAGATGVRRGALLAVLMGQLSAALDMFAREGFAPFRDAWDAAHAHRGREVAVHSGDGRCEHGVALGADGDGALLVRGEHGVRRHVSGEVSVRLR